MTHVMKATVLIIGILATLVGLTIYGNSRRQPRRPPRTQEELNAERKSTEEWSRDWYKDHPPTQPTASERYLDSRTGAALERTVKRVISMTGYRCDRVRTIERVAAEELARIGAQDGRWVDCNEDGVYGVLESADGFRAVKR